MAVAAVPALLLALPRMVQYPQADVWQRGREVFNRLSSLLRCNQSAPSVRSFSVFVREAEDEHAPAGLATQHCISGHWKESKADKKEPHSKPSQAP